MIQLVFALGLPNKFDGRYVFGKENGLPWSHIKEDMKMFSDLTMNTVLIMGHNTFRSLPCRLKYRSHVVISTDTKKNIRALNGDRPNYAYRSLEEALKMHKTDVSIIGGAGLIEEGFKFAEKAVINYIMLDDSYDNINADVIVEAHKLNGYLYDADLKLESDNTIMLDHDVARSITTTVYLK